MRQQQQTESARTTTSRPPIVSATVPMTAPTQMATSKCLDVTVVKSLQILRRVTCTLGTLLQIWRCPLLQRPAVLPESRRMSLIYANLIRTGNPNNHSRIPTVPGHTKPAKSMPNGSLVQEGVRQTLARRGLVLGRRRSSNTMLTRSRNLAAKP